MRVSCGTTSDNRSRYIAFGLLKACSKPCAGEVHDHLPIAHTRATSRMKGSHKLPLWIISLDLRCSVHCYSRLYAARTSRAFQLVITGLLDVQPACSSTLSGDESLETLEIFDVRFCSSPRCSTIKCLKASEFGLSKYLPPHCTTGSTIIYNATQNLQGGCCSLRYGAF